MLTFKKFLNIINEDASTDQMITNIQTSINQLDNQITQRTGPLLKQKEQLQKRLMLLMKKKQQSDVQNARQNNQQTPMNNINPTNGLQNAQSNSMNGLS
ncbi:MAG: hypothetical protein ACXW2E_00905 [Nitrososphaeraceae archaeon]